MPQTNLMIQTFVIQQQLPIELKAPAISLENRSVPVWRNEQSLKKTAVPATAAERGCENFLGQLAHSPARRHNEPVGQAVAFTAALN